MLEIPFSKAVQKGFTIAGTEMGLFLTQTGPQKSRNVPPHCCTLCMGSCIGHTGNPGNNLRN